jgi:hypothetical protein
LRHFDVHWLMLTRRCALAWPSQMGRRVDEAATFGYPRARSF